MTGPASRTPAPRAPQGEGRVHDASPPTPTHARAAAIADAAASAFDAQSVPVDARDLGYLRFPWVIALHRLRWGLSRTILLAGACIAVPALLSAALAALTGSGAMPVWPLPGMHPLTLLCVMALAGALALHRPMRPPPRFKRPLIWAVTVICIARVALPPLLPGTDAGLAALSVLLQPGNRATMGGNTAAALLLLTGMLLIHRRHPNLATALLALVPLPAVLTLTGHIYGVERVSGAMSVPTALAILALAACALSVISHRRSVRVMLSDGQLGRLTRAQVLLAFTAPLIAGADLFAGQHERHLIFVTFLVWLFTALVMLSMREYERGDFRRRLLERRLLAMSLSDPLTGIASRRGAEFLTARLLRNAHERGEAVSVIMVDLDRFKKINDTHGHGLGDKVIARAARLMEGRLRSTDGLVRWGGEEFVVILPNTGITPAAQVAEALREILERDLATGLLPGKGRITASFGCAQVASGEGSLTEAIARADRALYAAKAGGRNRVCLAPAASGDLDMPLGGLRMAGEGEDEAEAGAAPEPAEPKSRVG